MSDFEAGIFLIDKPAGISSFGVVSRVKRILKMKKVGHAGTLDPFATGLLIICAGRPATKLISQFMDGVKEYEATLKLGVETETMDPEGNEISRQPVGTLAEDEIIRCLGEFKGSQMQQPPIYSALKHKGKPLYYYARKGIEVKKDPREVIIHTLERIGDGDLKGDHPELKIRVVCSKGTYIRVLGSDIGKALGSGACLTELRRTKSGVFSVENSLTAEDFQADNARERFLQKVLSVEDAQKLLQ